MEPLERYSSIGNRLPDFQAAAACLGVGPKLRRAGRFCILVGGIATLLLLFQRVPATAPVLWAYLALVGFGIYLHLPNPQPWALPAAGLVILAVLAEGIYVDYELWHRFHVAPQGDGIGMIIEIILALALLGSYLSYKRNLTATDADTLATLRRTTQAVNGADLDQDVRIVEFTRKNNRVRLCRLGEFVLLVARHYVAFGIYSKLDGVAILKPEAITIDGLGTSKPGRPVKLRFSAPRMKPQVIKVKPEYLSRVGALGIAATNLPAIRP